MKLIVMLRVSNISFLCNKEKITKVSGQRRNILIEFYDFYNLWGLFEVIWLTALLV